MSTIRFTDIFNKKELARKIFSFHLFVNKICPVKNSCTIKQTYFKQTKKMG